MFKLESYIAPVLLNYVGKYVKNFKPEQSQVSLWGGDAAFQNLDLRLSVLNDQLDLPFTFVSGHIHELLIHVPWVKITSEPIVITINTIECILKLKDGAENPILPTSPPRPADPLQLDAPPGYIKSIITRVVNSITINCSNLILKFVEEDIVLSVNIRFLSIQTVNSSWQPTISSSDELHKLITIEDLTLCLDRMDSSGKIDSYQDPVMYRCSMSIRLILNHQYGLKRLTITRFDIHCERMEFSMTEQQIPMLLRLIMMMLVLQSRRPAGEGRRSSGMEEREGPDAERVDEVMLVPAVKSASWGSWAWGMVASVVPGDWAEELSPEEEFAPTGPTIHCGIYIDNAILTLKTAEIMKDSFAPKPMKMRYRPFLSLSLAGVVGSVIQQGMTVTALRIGVGSVRLMPRGSCCCGFREVKASVEGTDYLFAGGSDENYLRGCLFDEDYSMTGDYAEEAERRFSSEEGAREFFKNCPALVIDFVHLVRLPEDIRQTELLELAGNFEYSNFNEQEVTRILIGEVMMRICSGLLHRFSMIKRSIEGSNIWDLVRQRNEPVASELPPVTVEEYDSLNEFIPTTETIINAINLSIHFQLADHRSIQRMKNVDQAQLLQRPTDYPRLVLNFDRLEGRISAPMYPFRLAACASKQERLPERMLARCYRRINGSISGLISQLHLTESSHNSLIIPCDVSCTLETLIYPQYWTSPDTLQTVQSLRLDNLTVTTTKPKLHVAHAILASILRPESTNPLLSSSLFQDAASEINPIYLELCIENIDYSCEEFLERVARSCCIGSVRVFVLDDSQQAFVLSGPERTNSSAPSSNKLISVSLRSSRHQEESKILIDLRISETRLSLDPLFRAWLGYQSKFYDVDAPLTPDNYGNEETSSENMSTRKKTFPSLHENVHSPSERERKWSWMLEKGKKENCRKVSVKSVGISRRITNSYFLWRRIGVACSIEPVIIYIPTRTIDGVEMNGIEEAKSRALALLENLRMLVIKTAHLRIHSANYSSEFVENFSANNFPWTLRLTEFYCYTLTRKRRLNFVRMESLNGTIDATIKQSTSEASSNTLGFCIYIDTSPIMIACSEEQISLINEIIQSNSQIIQSSAVNNPSNSDNQLDILLLGPEVIQSPHILCTTEETDVTSTASTTRNDSESEENGLSIMTAWIQWTITKVGIKVYTVNSVRGIERKMVMQLEDIITSLDWQPVYVQLKNKVTTATIFHYVKTGEENWRLGEFLGIVMCSGEGDDLAKGMEEEDFLTVTVTRARSNNVYNKWSAYGKHQKPAKEYSYGEESSSSSYITEIVVKMQIIEVILPIDILREFSAILRGVRGGAGGGDEGGNPRCLPLIYAEFRGMRLVLPIVARRTDIQHDTIVMRTESIQVVPHAENPICRIIARPDIYELAAQANILNTPGSAVEDRQYEIKSSDILVYSTSWLNYQVSLTRRNAQSSLCTMNENPALEWNNMMENCEDEKLQCLPLSMAFDVCWIFAPPIIYKAETVVCGSAIEVTCSTDIQVSVNLEQIRLLTMLLDQFGELFRAEAGEEQPQRARVLPPFEYLMNFGKISVIVYETSRPQPGEKSGALMPLISVLVNQPNTYVSQQNFTRTFQINCFDACVSLPAEDRIVMDSIPAPGDFRKLILETKNGDPHPKTGIPPSFLIIKLQNNGNSNSVNFDMGRPTRISLSLPVIEWLDRVGRKLTSALNAGNHQSEQENLLKLSDLNVSTKQLVLILQSESTSELVMSASSIASSLGNKNKRMSASVSLNSGMITTRLSGDFYALLNPMSCSFSVSVTWETWNDANEVPQGKIQGFSDDISMDIGPRQLRVLGEIQECLERLAEKFQRPGETPPVPQSCTAEQHYQDDLKVGAFQFIDGSLDELPLPYQVIFSNQPHQAMVWRYPQPRILTRLHINPILLSIIEENDEESTGILCIIEFWSDTLMSYQRCAEFPITEMRRPMFELPNKFPTRAVACVWKLTLHSARDLDSRTLAGCLRIDSYFNSSLISAVEMTLSIKSINLALHNHTDSSIYRNLAAPLESYRLSNIVPSSQCFSIIRMKNILLVMNRWEESLLLDLSGGLSIEIMDYAHLKMQRFLEEVCSKLQISKSDQTSLVLVSQDVRLNFGPEIAHTLTLSYGLWRDGESGRDNGVILTRIVVANNSNAAIKFGQSQSPEAIHLESFECYFYSWCRRRNESMRIAVKRDSWIWSRPFSVRREGVREIAFDEIRGLGIHLNVKSLSPTQSLLIVCGQLIVCSKLLEEFELRLLRYESGAGSGKVVLEEGPYAIRSGRPVSMVINGEEHFAVRLRYASLPGGQWTGDIPLRANAKCEQPWLVKVPSQGRVKFQSIWVRIVREVSGCGRILVVLSPLYLVRSLLPVDVRARLETPMLSAFFDTTIQGRGEIQQLNCPGTFENYHQLTLDSRHEIVTTQASIPVSYGCIDQRSFFRRPQRENVDEILERLYEKPGRAWPFRDDDEEPWRPVEQGRTHASIVYQDAGLVSSTLILEIRPWCFIMNSLGRRIRVVRSDGEVLTEIPHRSVAAPPKFEGLFRIEIEVESEFHCSMPLQLATSERNRGFIVPQITGLVPADGRIRLSIDCGPRAKCNLIISSSVQGETRALRVTSSHVFCNFTGRALGVGSLLADSSGVSLPNDLDSLRFDAAPSASERTGVSVTQWHRPVHLNADKSSNDIPFVTLSAGFGWSCPVRVDQPISRNCVSIPSEGGSIPVVLSTQEDKGVIYVVASVDEHPQMLISNYSSFDLIVGVANSDGDGIQLDAPPFTWACEIPSGESRHYTAPAVGALLPDAASPRETRTTLLLTSKRRDWRRSIDIPIHKPIRFDQFVRIDNSQDLKIMVESRGHTVYISVEPKSRIEVSVKDIRSRLALEEAERSAAILPSSSAASDQPPRSPRSSPKPAERNEDKSFTAYVKGISLIVSQDAEAQRIEVASFYLVHTMLNLTATSRSLSLGLMISDFQFDNQMFDQGGFDFPVVLISQKPGSRMDRNFSALSLENMMSELRRASIFSLECLWERLEKSRACKTVHVRISPINIYIEDKFVTQLLDYVTSMLRPCLSVSPLVEEPGPQDHPRLIDIPASVTMDARIMSSPLRIQSLILEPISILLSVHTSVRLYVALDHSPLHFGIFEREELFTTPYRLGNALTMHYLSGAIFGAGWVVGSLEILGSPGSFAQALGSGLKDFIALPFQGLLQGPWGFIVGVTHGSASLMRNITAGTVNSLTKLASSVARNLDRLTLDEEHVQRQEESRKTRPQGMAEGLYQGLTGFGISVLGAVAGLAHHPLQNLLNGETSARGLVTGVGLGLVGVVTKPLSGAAELVALTGQGLLQRTGWNSLPSARRRAVPDSMEVKSPGTRYTWKLAALVSKNSDRILYLTDADFVDNEGKKREVTLVITRTSFIVVDKSEDEISRVFCLRELGFGEENDETSLSLSHSIPQQRQQAELTGERLEMDQEVRSRIEDYVIKNSGLVSLGDEEETLDIPEIGHLNYSINSLNFYLSPSEKRYLKDIMRILRRQGQGIDFTVL